MKTSFNDVYLKHSGVSAGGQIGGNNLLSLGFEANAFGNRPVIPGHQHYNGQYAYYSPYASSVPNTHSYYQPATTTYVPAYSARTVPYVSRITVGQCCNGSCMM